MLVVACAALPACASFRGPPPVYGPDGLNRHLRGSPANFALTSLLESRFRAAYSTPNSQTLTELHELGYQTVRANCHEWFRHMGSNERRSRLTRNLLTPITNVVNGLLALHDFSQNPDRKEDWLALITLGSSATVSGLDIYDEQFLFRAENIDSVRTMTMKDLRDAFEAQEPNRSSFGTVVNHLLQLQNECLPSHIAGRVREKIRGSEEHNDIE